jgi:hypothetical protein
VPDPIDRAEQRILARMTQWGERERDRLKASVGERFPPSSRPGEYPAKRSGNLQAKITAETRLEGGRVITRIRSGAHYSAKLVSSGRLLFQGLAAKWFAALRQFTRG